MKNKNDLINQAQDIYENIGLLIYEGKHFQAEALTRRLSLILSMLNFRAEGIIKWPDKGDEL